MKRFLVTWRDRLRPRTYPIGLLTSEAAGFRYFYLPQARSTPGFRPFVNFPDLDREYRSAALFPFFAQRVMDRRRPDYLSYIEALALPPDATDLDVLGRSNGQRKGDSVQVILEPQIGSNGSVDHIFLVSGVRHAPGDPENRLENLSPGDRLQLRPEPENPANPEALLVCTQLGDPFGWVPDALLTLAQEAMKRSYELTIVRINGPDWPSHLRVVVRLTGTVAPEFEPFPALSTLAVA